MATAIRIELISASVCNRCGDARKRLQSLMEELDDDRIQYREIDVLEQLDYAVSLGVLSTPAIAINGELVFCSMPSLKRLEDELNKRLSSL
jgi:hypothetical protein